MNEITPEHLPLCQNQMALNEDQFCICPTIRATILKTRAEISQKVRTKLMPLCVCESCPDSHAQARIVQQAIEIVLGETNE